MVMKKFDPKAPEQRPRTPKKLPRGGYIKVAVEGRGHWLMVLALAVLALAGATVVVTVALRL